MIFATLFCLFTGHEMNPTGRQTLASSLEFCCRRCKRRWVSVCGGLHMVPVDDCWEVRLFIPPALPSAPENPVPSGIEAEVCADIAARQTLGLRKYGQSLAENEAHLIERLQHAYEECLDQAIYLRWAMQKLRTEEVPHDAD